MLAQLPGWVPKNQPPPTQLNDISILEKAITDSLVVDSDAVGAMEILEQIAVGTSHQTGVVPVDLGVDQHQRVVWAATQSDKPPLRQNFFLQLGRFAPEKFGHG